MLNAELNVCSDHIVDGVEDWWPGTSAGKNCSSAVIPCDTSSCAVFHADSEYANKLPPDCLYIGIFCSKLPNVMGTKGNPKAYSRHSFRSQELLLRPLTLQETVFRMSYRSKGSSCDVYLVSLVSPTRTIPLSLLLVGLTFAWLHSFDLDSEACTRVHAVTREGGSLTGFQKNNLSSP